MEEEWAAVMIILIVRLFHIREHMNGIDVRQEALKSLTTGGVLSDRFSHGVSSTEG